ncbi:sulfurtransferase complex subunit TusD [Idiomarina sp. PL1-037]|uniref:sulfurtransferase complex subunit TusD n=1 Tax=Idiomarina sp. PL1-037 TaxID=3095365 RepID=UPI002ACC0F4A|nr:sulfurtransferase complex subunit TusD [Idiomarina sp. PL1-037]WQC51735.1 sulfurtransferase complex subunit TusD [Idiomarina sp. PL1-037]
MNGQFMAKLTLILQKSVKERAQSMDALAFAKAAIASGHTIACVFFYRESVNHAEFPTPTENEDLITQWEELSQHNQVPLVVCHTVAERKGMEKFHPSFEASGLTALATAMAASDRTLQF